MRINRIAGDTYFKNLLILRDHVARSCDDFFRKLGGTKVDLYLITKSISSPMGPGSDSLPLPIKFGNQNAMLTDSSQFGMEILTLKQFDLVFCYLPSFRGERPDDSHLNQFFHCEAEFAGNIDQAITMGNRLIRKILKDIVFAFERKRFHFERVTFEHVTALLSSKKTPEITFEEAFSLLSRRRNASKLLAITKFGRQLTRPGELELVNAVTRNRLPLWVKNFDRDVVPFYQKPSSSDSSKVLNADLLFPSVNGGFGGEVIGAGQRQDEPVEIVESLKRQKLNQKGSLEAYKWYIDLRKHPHYRTTSGFGLGVERLLAWVLCENKIEKVAVFPRKLNGDLYP